MTLYLVELEADDGIYDVLGIFSTFEEADNVGNKYTRVNEQYAYYVRKMTLNDWYFLRK